MIMRKHFDMDELFQHLISSEGNNGKTKVRDTISQLTRRSNRIYQPRLIWIELPNPTL